MIDVVAPAECVATQRQSFSRQKHVVGNLEHSFGAMVVPSGIGAIGTPVPI
jgi:hypothetical protein